MVLIICTKARVFLFFVLQIFSARCESRRTKKKKKNKIQCRLYFFSDISDVKVGGSKKK